MPNFAGVSLPNRKGRRKREDRDHIGQQQDQADREDVVRDRVQHDADQLENRRGPLGVIVPGDQPDQVTEDPGNECRGQQQAQRPGQRPEDHRVYRLGVERDRRPEIELGDDALHVVEILREQVALEAVELLEIDPHIGDRLGRQRAIGARLQLRDIGVDRIGRHEARQEERDRQTNEQNDEIKPDPLGYILQDAHVSLAQGKREAGRTGRKARPAASDRNYCFPVGSMFRIVFLNELHQL